MSVQFTVQFWNSVVNKNVFSLRLNSGVERKSINSINILLQARGATTEKALSPNLRLVRGTMKSPRPDDRTEGLPRSQQIRSDY